MQSHLDEIQLQGLKQECRIIRDRARINTIASPYVGPWIRATSNRNIGLAMCSVFNSATYEHPRRTYGLVLERQIVYLVVELSTCLNT